MLQIKKSFKQLKYKYKLIIKNNVLFSLIGIIQMLFFFFEVKELENWIQADSLNYISY